MLFGHGNEKIPDIKLKADFSSNVHYNGIPSMLKEHLQNHISLLANYPEADAGSLKEAIAKHYHLAPENILVTNGSADAFYLIAQAFSNATTNIFIPSFSEYEDACQANSHQIEYLKNDDLSPTTFFGKQTVWIGNPNNPDGHILTPDLLKRWMDNNPDTTFVVDEAYAELCKGFDSIMPLVNADHNLIVTRSFTKAFVIPGLRLGFLAASSSLISKIESFKAPWSVNALSVEAGKYILEHYNELIPHLPEIVKSVDHLYREIDAIDNFEILPTGTNYLLVRSKKIKAANLKVKLLNDYGLLIRNASNFRGLNEYYFRIAANTPSNNQLLIDALKTISKNEL